MLNSEKYTMRSALAALGAAALVAVCAIALTTPARASAQQPNLAEKCKSAKSMSDPCFNSGSYVIDQSKAATAGRQQVGKTTIYITGKTADGKYNVYNVEGDLSDTNWTAGNRLYSANDMIALLDGVPTAAMGKNGVKCETICKNAAGQVIGVPEGYKQIAKKK